MALTPSTMLALGTKAPDFQLPDVVTGKMVGLKTFEGKKGLLVMFICSHCPYVQHVKGELARLGKDYAPGGVSGSASDSRSYAPGGVSGAATEGSPRGASDSGSHAGQDVGIVAISANDPEHYPDDAPEKLKEMALQLPFSFPYLFDEGQETAKAYSAACTPDFFLFDQNRKLVYRGQLDDSRPGNGKPVTGRDLRAAIDAVLKGQPVEPDQKPSVGCSIKWKPGREPAYAR